MGTVIVYMLALVTGIKSNQQVSTLSTPKNREPTYKMRKPFNVWAITAVNYSTIGPEAAKVGVSRLQGLPWLIKRIKLHTVGADVKRTF